MFSLQHHSCCFLIVLAKTTKSASEGFLKQWLLRYYNYWRWYELAFGTHFPFSHYTCRRIKWGEHGTYATLPTLIPWQEQPHSNPRTFLKPGHWVRIYSNQKDTEYISASNIRAGIWNPPLPTPTSFMTVLYFSPVLPSLTFYGPFSPSLARLCDTRTSILILGLFTSWLRVLCSRYKGLSARKR